MKLAKTSSLDALISENNLKYKKAEEMVAFSDNLPKVNIFGEYGGTKMKHFSETDDNQEWRGGVQIDWEFFNFGSGIDKYRVAKENYKIQELDDSIVQDNIEINLTTAYSEVIRLEKLRKANKNSLEASRENYNIDKERYDAGLISTQDFLDSEVQYREAKINYNQAESDYLIAFEKYRTLLI
jgi:OMF family outer membrane factor